MYYKLNVRLEAYHKPSESWFVYEAPHGLRAVSRRHALNKALKVGQSWPGYTDRAGHPDWTSVTVEATVVEGA